ASGRADRKRSESKARARFTQNDNACQTFLCVAPRGDARARDDFLQPFEHVICRSPRPLCHSEESRAFCGATKNLSGPPGDPPGELRDSSLRAARTENGPKAKRAAA